jgi:hypothetical protein
MKDPVNLALVCICLFLGYQLYWAKVDYDGLDLKKLDVEEELPRYKNQEALDVNANGLMGAMQQYYQEHKQPPATSPTPSPRR